MNLSGVGEKTERKLKKIGILKAEDFLQYYPNHYEYFPYLTYIKDLAHLEEGTVVSIWVQLKVNVMRSGKVTRIWGEDSSGDINISWFHPPYTVRQLKRGSKAVLRGPISFFRDKPCMFQPSLYSPEEYKELLGKMLPVYPSTSGISQRLLRSCVREALEMEIPETLPETVLQKYNLYSRADALREIHFPQSESTQKQAVYRLKFEEFYQFKKELAENYAAEEPNACPMKKSSLLNNVVIKGLPYTLTNAQQQAWKKLETELCGKYRANQLIQGDVGAGKTIVGFLAMLLAVDNGYQAVLMAPTEVLAEQHYEDMMGFLKNYNLPYACVLVTGTTKQKKAIYRRIADGTANLIIGTHAVISESVAYQKLGIVIIDEQHRFGVSQRTSLQNKGKRPHVVTMSATPIPRSLGLILYGDMDISIINERPANRLPLKNCVISRSERSKAWRMIYRQIQQGRQAYIICPMVEQNPLFPVADVQSYAEFLRKEYPPDVQIGILHGKLSAKEKASVMEKFQKNEIQLLIATTVVEVGVNVPNASVIMIEDADRFGMAQLHQLRGRVGRGKWQSYCIFVNGNNDPCERLDIMESTNDGFVIAEKDMELRGVGLLLGERQSGKTSFVLADVYHDTEILRLAAEAVEESNKKSNRRSK